MENIASKQWILDFKKRYALYKIGQALLFAIAIAVFVSTILNQFFAFNFLLTFALSGFGAFVLVYAINNKSFGLAAFASYLNQRFPELEESTQLILTPNQSLTFLQQLQAKKVAETLVTLPQPNDGVKKLKSGFLILLLSILISFGVQFLPNQFPLSKLSGTTSAKAKTVIDKILPQIKTVKVVINSPVYTQIDQEIQSQFTLNLVSGSAVIWELETNTSVQNLKLIFNNQEVLALQPIDTEKTKWKVTKSIKKSGFYQVSLDGELSDLYQIEAKADLPISIKILKPTESQTVIDFGQPQKVDFQAELSDDFGIQNAFISATITSGRGEGVSFKEQNIAFKQPIKGKSVTLKQNIDLRSLGMKPGDELYFYVKAKDNFGQESRSDIYSVAIQDTSELMSLTGLASGVNLVPEYFRSQRQIIIDTEKLLKEKSTISEQDFKNRSNNLGLDQKLLRLRYGKFLGEESETYGSEGEVEEHSADDGHDHGSSENAKFGDVQAIIDKYAHNHDNLEEGTFFEPKLKAQLKATLAEMWNSELRLRTFKTQEALPFAYKALRLLKDLQQSSRAYVAKTVVKTTPIKAEKRLTGELDKITSPNKQKDFEADEAKNAQLKSALNALAKLREKQILASADKSALQSAKGLLIEAASQNPTSYLAALKAMNQTKKLSLKEIDLVENALQKLIKPLQSLPQAKNKMAAGSLSESYFQNLKNAN
ncbi:MAG: hypothetical protein IE931_08145 [Sphingobacteriales bacterium]|nr:hypothetical protein [Sphingobacteriales bacterium]